MGKGYSDLDAVERGQFTCSDSKGNTNHHFAFFLVERHLVYNLLPLSTLKRVERSRTNLIPVDSILEIFKNPIHIFTLEVVNALLRSLALMQQPQLPLDVPELARGDSVQRLEKKRWHT